MSTEGLEIRFRGETDSGKSAIIAAQARSALGFKDPYRAAAIDSRSDESESTGGVGENPLTDGMAAIVKAAREAFKR